MIVHKVAGGGFWAEVPALPGCATQAETMEELMANVREAVDGWLDVKADAPTDGEILEIAV